VVSEPDLRLPRLRQAVLAARELEPVAQRLQAELELGEPFSDPGVAHFGLQNAVFALGDTFLEVVSPVRPDTAAGRLLDRRGGDCGYMLMFQIEDLDDARQRARAAGVREVFEVALEDIAEVHLHPADMRGAIVSLSSTQPPDAWRWGGPDWERRTASGRVAGAKLAVADPAAVVDRWGEILGVAPMRAGVHFTHQDIEGGLIEITIATSTGPRDPFELGGVRFAFESIGA
jgi:glyoxalase-like protein